MYISQTYSDTQRVNKYVDTRSLGIQKNTKIQKDTKIQQQQKYNNSKLGAICPLC
jgi:hypothetical protein